MLSYPKFLVSRLGAERARVRQLAHLDALPDYLRRDVGLPVRNLDPDAIRRRSLTDYDW